MTNLQIAFELSKIALLLGILVMASRIINFLEKKKGKTDGTDVEDVG